MKNDSQNFKLTLKRCFLLLMFGATMTSVYAEIRNGYAVRIVQLKESLASLKTVLEMNERSKVSSRRNLEAKIADIENKILYYELTEFLLEEFKTIAPDMYTDIDTIKDNKGRSVDVYVKFVPAHSTPVAAWGTTYMAQAEGDADAYMSEYGVNTVSVIIWTVKTSLVVLSHELGHVKYQIQNLASYAKYYTMQYGKGAGLNRIGHNHGDPSGANAVEFEMAFRKRLTRYVSSSSHKVKSPFTFLKTRNEAAI